MKAIYIRSGLFGHCSHVLFENGDLLATKYITGLVVDGSDGIGVVQPGQPGRITTTAKYKGKIVYDYASSQFERVVPFEMELPTHPHMQNVGKGVWPMQPTLIREIRTLLPSLPIVRVNSTDYTTRLQWERSS
jgi:hypothetical protein